MERHPKIIIGKTKTSCLSAIKDNMWLSMVMPLKCTFSKVLVLLRTERERNTVGKKNYTTADSLGCWGPGSPYRSVPGTSSGPWWLCLLSFSLLLSGSRARCFTDRETAFSGCETAKDIENQERKKEETAWTTESRRCLVPCSKSWGKWWKEFSCTRWRRWCGWSKDCLLCHGDTFFLPYWKNPLLGHHGTGLPKPK